MKKLILTICIITSISTSAQELESLLLAGDDASKLTEGYVNPLMKGLMYSMNGGWYTTGKTHKKFGFDLTINANASFVPDAGKTFVFSPNDYTFLTTANGETTLQTVMSENDDNTQINIRIPVGDGTYKVGSFEMPGGIAEDLPASAVPTPMVQLGFGLPFKTDIKLRLVPTLKFDDDKVSTNLFGLGLQHDLTQYFGKLEKLPLNVSVLAAFTNMKVAYAIEDESSNDNVSVSNGEAEFKMNTWTVQAIGSLDFKFISLYGALGYNNGSSSVKMKGDYALSYTIEDSNGNPIGSQSETVSDPVNLDFDANGMRATIGARLNLAFFKIFSDYTFQEYNTWSAGIAFSFR